VYGATAVEKFESRRNTSKYVVAAGIWVAFPAITTVIPVTSISPVPTLGIFTTLPNKPLMAIAGLTGTAIVAVPLTVSASPAVNVNPVTKPAVLTTAVTVGRVVPVYPAIVTTGGVPVKYPDPGLSSVTDAMVKAERAAVRTAVTVGVVKVPSAFPRTDTTTVGILVYPVPAFVTVTALIAPDEIVQVAVAPDPPPPTNVIIGASAYPVPAVVIVTVVEIGTGVIFNVQDA
tara:strand:+ start:631 stop:1323 length:693 start_codon:yes stop_codon:yes gene_type:complete